MPNMIRVRTLTRSLLVVLAVTGPATACGGDDDSASSSATTTTSAPEEMRTSATAVAAGLHEIDAIGNDIVAALDAGETDKAKQLEEKIEPAWQKIEGTVKANDENTYLAFEDAFAAIGLAIDGGDSAKARKASDDISSAVTAYLKAYRP